MAPPHFSNRIRFNMGYWDGVAEEKRGQDNRCFAVDSHYDQVYRHGYLEGYNRSACRRVDNTSTRAWDWAISQGYVTA